PTRSCSIASRSADRSPSMCCCPTNSSSVVGRARWASGAVSGSRSRAASANRSPTPAKYAQHVSRREQTGLQDEVGAILTGPGASDYERYLRTDELLALQKTEAERNHHDELLFQVTHQSSELWLKLAAAEVETATDQLRGHDPRAAARSLRRSILALKLITE